MILDVDLLRGVREQLADSDSFDDESISQALRVSGRVLGVAEVTTLTEAMRAEISGLGPLEPLLGEVGVTDVLVNAPEEVWTDRGNGLEQRAIRFPDEAAVRHLAVRLAARASRRLDEATPFVDARLPGGQRFHAIIPPLSVRGTVISLRIPARRQFTMGHLVEAGSVDARGADWMAALIHARVGMLITGGTGCGKTAVLGALLGLVPPTERIVVVEDTCELAPLHPHVVSLEARTANVEGGGEIPMRTLVRQALRMRPDRLVIGEVRGAEVVDMLAAMNTGHEGGAATVHANSPGAVPDRIAALGQAAGTSRDAMLSQLAAGVEAIIHVTRGQDGRRAIGQVAVLVRRAGTVEVRPALVRRDGQLAPAPGLALLADRIGSRP